MSQRIAIVLVLAGLGLAALAAMPPGGAATKPAMAPMSNCDPNMVKQCKEDVAIATIALDAARKAVAAGDMKVAASELEKLAKSLASIKDGLDKCMIPAPMPAMMMGMADPNTVVKVVNARCPILSTNLDMSKVPADLTRTYKGQIIGFCCAGCPEAWDKLSDADKDAKLAKAMTSLPPPR